MAETNSGIADAAPRRSSATARSLRRGRRHRRDRLRSGGGDDERRRRPRTTTTADTQRPAPDLPGGRGRRAPTRHRVGRHLRHRPRPAEGPDRQRRPVPRAVGPRPGQRRRDRAGRDRRRDRRRVYKGQPDPLQQAIVEGAGADTDPDAASQTAVDYSRMFEDVYETYGRTSDVEIVEATGGPDDATAAQADAQKAIDMEPFAVLGGPTTTPRGTRRSSTPGSSASACGHRGDAPTRSRTPAPYLWPTGPTPEQADAHLLEMVGKQLVGKPAEFAGDPALQSRRARVRLGPGRDRDRRVQGPQRRLRGASCGGVRRRDRRPVHLLVRSRQGRRRSPRRPSPA